METSQDRYQDSMQGWHKLFIIGLDGATLDLLQPLMSQGLLPNLASVASNGVYGKLLSTIPPVSAPAWASFMTGMNPGKHGVFDFRLPTALSPKRNFTNASHIKAKTLWRVLSEQGRRVGVLNVPMTYPAEQVNGFLMGGILEAAGSQNCSWPPALYSRLISHLGSYTVELDWNAYREALIKSEKGVEKLIADVIKLTRQRAKTALWLMDEYQWDFFCVVFVSLDRLQHFIWKYVDPTHPEYRAEEAARYGNQIRQYYQELDRAIGEILNMVGSGVNVLILSDHGFGSQVKRFYLGRWLVQEDYLKMREGRLRLRGLLKKFDVAGLRRTILNRFTHGLRSSFNVYSCIDWQKTRAYPGTSSEQGIYINLKGREPEGVVSPGSEYETLVDDICAKLTAVKDPEDGLPVVDRIFKQGEVFKGPYAHLGPDVVFILRGMSYLAKEDVGSLELFEPSKIESGSHRLDGLLLAQGPDIGRGSVEGAKLIDLMPTSLHLLGLPIPREVDGCVLRKLIKPGSVADRHVRYMETRSDLSTPTHSYTSEEEEELIRKLSGLGYMG